MALLSKSQNAESIKDYCPISLIHVLGKLFSKVLANRLTPRLEELIHVTQSAFMKGRYIQDNFRYVQSSAKLLHDRRHSSLLLKVNISRAFDLVYWPFLLDAMSFVGFPTTWREWIAVLSSASTRIQLNGAQGDRICHARGLCQGDPLSPMMFVLVMEVLNSLFHKADYWSLLQKLPPRHIPFRVSMYADDMVLFFTPIQGDLQLAKAIFELFEKASCLGCNVAKCQMVPIRCSSEKVVLAQELFPCPVKDFPIVYLGIPLSTSKLPKSVFQPMVDKMADRLPAWKGRLMHRSGHLALIKSTLVAMPVYTAISHALPPWVIKAFVQIFRGFLWAGSKATHGGQ
jgi:hypothetical protein